MLERVWLVSVEMTLSNSAELFSNVATYVSVSLVHSSSGDTLGFLTLTF